MKTRFAWIPWVLAGLGLLGLWGLARAQPASFRWGADGHRMATRAAHEIMPPGMPPFFLEGGEQLEYLSPEPDRWRSGMLRAMDEAWKYDHYIDLENVPPGALEARDRFEFMAALTTAGIGQPQVRVGFLPFRILELTQRLSTGFAQWRLSRNGSERRWMEERILNDAGILGHYVVDASQPHHTTIHFNGWAEGAPNPRGFTTDREFHSRFESAFVRAHLAYEDISSGMPPAPRNLPDTRAAVLDFIRSSNAMVEEMYEMEKDTGFESDIPPHPEARAFVVERLRAGAEMLAAVWWTAWLESEELAEELRWGG